MKRFLAIFLLLAGQTALHAQLLNVAPDLLNDLTANLTTSENVIVQLDHLPGVLDTLGLSAVGALVVGPLNLIDALLVSVPVPLIPVIAALPGVAYVSPDRPLGPLLDNTTAAVNAPAAWQAGWNGAGVGIAIIDSGIGSHADLAGGSGHSRVVYSADYTGGNGVDQFGHGTHVAGIAAGNGADSNCPNCTRLFSGMAPGATIVNLRVLDKTGLGTDSGIIRAIQQAVALRAFYNIRVINLSVGHPVVDSYKKDPLCRAVEAAWQAGIVVVVAAGNDGRDNTTGTTGYATINSPGNDPYVITVGAMKAMGTPARTDDLIASYSSKGPTAIDHIVKPDLVAPGNLTVSLLAPNATLLGELPQNVVPLSYYEQPATSGVSPYYFALSGTSMATPVVTGAVADLLQAHPNLTPDQVKGQLMKAAYKTFPRTSVATDPSTGMTYPSEYDIFTIGAGYLDLAAALQSAPPAAGTAVSPAAVYSHGNGEISLILDPASYWARQSAWGPNAVWGASVFLGSGTALWGTGAPWGTPPMTSGGFQAIWSSTSPWAATADAGTKSKWGTQTDAGTKSKWGTNFDGTGEN